MSIISPNLGLMLGGYNPRGSVVGGPVAAVDLNFLRDWGDSIADAVVTGPTLTHTRSTTQTGFDESGVLQTAATNDPAYDHDPGNSDAALGLLIEAAATNEAKQSEAIDVSPWTPFGSTVTTANDAVAPDGTTTADWLEDDDAGSYGGRYQNIGRLARAV